MNRLFALALGLVWIAPVHAQSDPGYPASWQGIWEVRTITRDCETLEIFSDSVSVDTLCAGDPLLPDVECGGTIDDETVDVQCSFSIFVCFVDVEATGTKKGDEFDVTIVATGSALCPEPRCQRIELTGRRIGSGEPACPPLTVDGEPWARIKSRYRSGAPLGIRDGR